MNIPPEDRYITPEDRFENLPNWSYTSKYTTVNPGDLKMAYVDEGPKDGKLFLLVHGNPIWGYSFRDVIPPLVARGYRVVVPDLIGFGKSEKILNPEYITYTSQEQRLSSFISELNLEHINLFAQDWGALLALRIVAKQQDLFDTVTISNGGLPTNDFKAGMTFTIWRRFLAKYAPSFAWIVQTSTYRKLSKEELWAYKAPFPFFKSSMAVRIMPSRLPTAENPIDTESKHNDECIQLLKKFDKPLLCIFSSMEESVAKRLTNIVPGAQGLEHKFWKDMRHFSQDDKGLQIAEELIRLSEKYV